MSAKKLLEPRKSATAQGIVVDHENHPPRLLKNHERGGGPGEKGAGTSIPGGSVDVLFNAVLENTVYENQTERDMEVLGFLPLELEGEKIEGRNSLTVLLRQYGFGVALSLKARRISKRKNGALKKGTVAEEGETVFLTLIPQRDETPLEAVKREVLKETGCHTELIRASRSYDPIHRSWRVSRWGEILYEPRSENHALYVFYLRPLSTSLRIEENDEVDEVSWVELGRLLTQILKETDARVNPDGFFWTHKNRILLGLWALGIPYKEHLPEGPYLHQLPKELEVGMMSRNQKYAPAFQEPTNIVPTDEEWRTWAER